VRQPLTGKNVPRERTRHDDERKSAAEPFLALATPRTPTQAECAGTRIAVGREERHGEWIAPNAAMIAR
jgi:hypothetical protein